MADVPLDTLSAIGSILLIDLVLSGDNAVVIGMAAHRLKRRQRRAAVLLGGGLAVVLRVTLTAIATMVLAIPAIKAIGGLLLLWIAYSLLREEEEKHDHLRAAATLRGAIVTILVADFVMSLDNVLGVAAAARGNLLLLLFGLMVSMAIVIFGGSLLAGLIDRLWWLAHVGAAVIAWTGMDLLLDDPLVLAAGVVPAWLGLPLRASAALLVVALGHLVHRHLPRLRAERVSAAKGAGDVATDASGRPRRAA